MALRASFVFAIAAIMVGASALTTPAHAQLGAAEYAKRQQDLVTLARIFGEMHHIRRSCAPRRESEVWRERMKRLVNLESPTTNIRQRMVQAFNQGFQETEARFPACRRAAEDYAAARAKDGAALTASLMAPLAGDNSADLFTPERSGNGLQ